MKEKCCFVGKKCEHTKRIASITREETTKKSCLRKRRKNKAL